MSSRLRPPGRRAGLAGTSSLPLRSVVSAAQAPPAQEQRDCFIFGPVNAATPFVSDAAECGRASAPASTFKVPHALIALQAGVITPDTVFPWDGQPRAYPGWQRDHTLRSAIQSSVLPFFQRTATLLGATRMREGLASLAFPSDGFDGEVSLFWLNGDLLVSPMEQFAFLQRLFAGRLPVAAAHLATVKDAIRMPPGQVVNASGSHTFTIDWPSAAIVYAKTGNTVVDGDAVSWIVGAVSLDGVDRVLMSPVRDRAALPTAPPASPSPPPGCARSGPTPYVVAGFNPPARAVAAVGGNGRRRRTQTHHGATKRAETHGGEGRSAARSAARIE